jgi:hypothetical protein
MHLRVEYEASDGFTLTEPLLAICFVSSIAIALTPPPGVRYGFAGHVIGFAVGTLVGGLGAWAMYSGLGMLVGRVPPSIDEKRWYAALVLLGMVLWILVVAVVSGWTSSSLLRLL